MMTTTAPTHPNDSRPTNPPRELARYRISAGERIVVGQRVLGIVRLTDVPAEGRGRRYVIERGLTAMAELEAVVADYLAEAERWDAVPVEPCWLAPPEAAAAR
jgi:hypothetical protein